VRRLRYQRADISELGSNHQPHATPIRDLIGRAGMRVIGKAFDKGIIKERSK
jgi:hypothetical protein